MFKSSIFKFFASLKLAVFSILSLASVLAFATVFESLFGMRAVHVTVYGTYWFTGVLVLLGTNVLCAALSRFPWKKHQIGFVLTHTGILTLLLGSFLTQQFGVDGNMPVTEGSQENEAILNDLHFVASDEAQNSSKAFPVQENYREVKGSFLEIAFAQGAVLKLDGYIPRAIAEKKLEASPIEGLGLPAVRFEVFNDRFRLEESILSQFPKKTTELNLGPALVTFQKLWNSEEEKDFFDPKPIKGERSSQGYLIASWQGKEYRLNISEGLKNWLPLGSEGLEVKIERYLPYAVVENNELVTRSEEAVNPAVQLLLRKKGNSAEGNEEHHTIFANFPEFSTLHGAHKKKEQLGVKFKMQAPQRPKATLAMVGNQRGELAFAQSASDEKLYYRVSGKDGSINVKGEVKIGDTVSTGWMDLQFRVNEWFPSAVEYEVPRSVEYISGSGDNYLSAVHVQEPGRKLSSNLGETGFWLFEGMGKLINIEGKEIFVQYTKKKIVLPFHLFLEKFKIGTDPGTQKAATYESDVVVKDLSNAVEKKANISMNEPLKYGGYTFYQASYSLDEGRPPVSIFAVNYDPGRVIKYLGSIFMVLGILVMFYMNPHYLALIFKRKGKQL